MKALEELTNTEKGRLLAEWFPQHLPEMVTAVENQQQHLKAHEREIRAQWGKAMITDDLWFRLADEAHTIIRNHRFSLQRNPKIFSDQLFHGWIAMFTIHCLVQYAEKEETDMKFKLAMSLLFDAKLRYDEKD